MAARPVETPLSGGALFCLLISLLIPRTVLHLSQEEVIILLHYGQNQGRILASTYPELAEQWNYDKNGALTPWEVTIGSGRKVWWICSVGHEWESAICDRTRKSNGCH